MTPPRLAHYDWRDGREAMLRFGPDTGPIVIAALPLFEEANRTRAAMVDVLRRLAGRGIASALPDLPGTGESLVATEDARLEHWREAFAAAAGSLSDRVFVIAWRGGALVDGDTPAAARWYLSPVEGAALVRDLRRAANLAGSDDFAGNAIAPAMLDALSEAEPTTIAPTRIVRLASDPRPADGHLDGPPLWRSSEPTTDSELQERIATDIAGWIAACAA